MKAVIQHVFFMKKALRDDPETFFSYVDGRITPWDNDDEGVLVKAANNGLRHSCDKTTLYIDDRMLFESAVANWLTQIFNEGVTEPMVEELNQMTAEIKYRRLLYLEEGAEPRWFSIADIGEEHLAEHKAAYAIIHLVGSGAFQRLKRCEEEACEKFYLGRPDSTWCSKRCGCRARGKNKRRRDRESGVLPGT